jgi:hypothetical protein
MRRDNAESTRVGTVASKLLVDTLRFIHPTITITPGTIDVAMFNGNTPSRILM